MQTILPYLPVGLRRILSTLSSKENHPLQEIRIREGRPLEVVWGGGFGFVSAEGSLVRIGEQAYVPTRQECAQLLEQLTEHSMYTFEEELKRGFITVRGGHRIGLAGRAIIEQGKVKYIKDISGFNIRIAREWKNAAKPALPYVIDHRLSQVYRTLIVSPPQLGKTTFIRDLARLLSEGIPLNGSMNGMKSFKVGIVDERSEIAACSGGVPSFDVGPRTDVLDGCPKAEGMMMMIRSMSPDVLVADEIGRAEDAAAIHEALHAGIGVIATAHGRDVDDCKQRPILKGLLESGIFERFIVLSRGRSQGGSYGGPELAVFDPHGKRLDDRLQLRGGSTL